MKEIAGESASEKRGQLCGWSWCEEDLDRMYVSGALREGWGKKEGVAVSSSLVFRWRETDSNRQLQITEISFIRSPPIFFFFFFSPLSSPCRFNE